MFDGIVKVLMYRLMPLTYLMFPQFCKFDVEEAVIPAQIRIKKTNSFDSHLRNKKLKSIKFEANSELKTIEESAFYQAEIEDLLIPEGVEEIGNDFFFWVATKVPSF